MTISNDLVSWKTDFLFNRHVQEWTVSSVPTHHDVTFFEVDGMA